MQILSAADFLCYYIFDYCEFLGVPGTQRELVAIAFNVSFGASYILGSVCFVQNFNRKTLFGVFGLLQAALCAALGALIYLGQTQNVFLVTSLLVGLAVCYSFGVGPVGYAIIMELAPIDAASVCVALPHAIRYLVLFTQNKTFYEAIGTFGPAGYLFILASSVVMGESLYLIFAPETRRLSISELSELFEKKLTAN